MLRAARTACTLLLFGMVVVFCSPRTAAAADIALTITVTAQDDRVRVRIENRGRDIAPGLSLTVDLDTRSYTLAVPPLLQPGAVTESEVRVTRPSRPGRYPLITRLGYLNEGHEVDLLDVGTFDFISARAASISCPALDLMLRSEFRTPVATPAEYSVRVIAPRGVDARFEPSMTGALAASDLVLKSRIPELRLQGTLAVIYERDSADWHDAAICRGRLQTRRVVYDRWPVGTKGIALLTFLFLGVAALCARAEQVSQRQFLLARWIGTCGLLCGVLLFYRAMWDSMERLFLAASAQQSVVPPGSGRQFFLKAIDAFHLDGPNYDPFFQYGVPSLAAYLLLGHYFTIRYLVRPKPESDKVWALLRGIGGRGFTLPAWIALRVLAVKGFFLPLLGSWAITRIFFDQEWARLPSSMEGLVPWLIGVFILIDVVIFAIGYLVELPQLRNEIRSAEPTIFGWLVCILCYPPFNELLLPLIDHPLDSGITSAGAGLPLLHTAATWLTLILWAIYVWATIALGFKASNLTNRGIVAHGPYRFVRHPAYASKLAVWLIAWAVFGTLNLTLALALIGLYGLRALTEERHLEMDPEYAAYAERVRFRAIPGVW